MFQRESTMKNARKGLRLISFSIIINIAWSIASIFIKESVSKSFSMYLQIIAFVILLICHLVYYGGLRLAGRDNDEFRFACKLKLISLLLTIVNITFAIVVVMIKNSTLEHVFIVFAMITNIVIQMSELFILLYVIKGCREISPRVLGLSKFVGGLFIAQTILIITLQVLSFVISKLNDNPSGSLLFITVIIAFVFSLVAILFAIFYVLLIFRATATVGKRRNH